MFGEHLQGLGDVRRLKHLEPSILQDAGRVHQDQEVVIDDEGVGRIALGVLGHATGMDDPR